jgi:hypothetical protein
MNNHLIFLLLAALLFPGSVFAQVTDVAALMAAVNGGAPGASVQIAPGTYALTAPLQPKSGMTLVGAGSGLTIFTAAAGWSPGLAGLPDNSVDHNTVVRAAYLIDLGNDAMDVTLGDLTLTAPQHHGAIYGNNCDRLHLRDMRFENFLWCGVRTFRMDGGRIHDCSFLDAGGRSGGSTGQNGGSVFTTFVKTSEFWNNRIAKSAAHPGNFFGFKGRQAIDCRIHHNTVGVSFAVEFPFENDRNVEIDHNDFNGGVSIPKFGGGAVVPPADGRSFHIHHNWVRRSYALEWARNSAEIDHNFFDFSLTDDTGNLVSNFGSEAAPGPTFFHNNHIRNPGRGLFWSMGVFNGLTFANNHVRANTLTRSDGLFGFNPANDFTTTIIRDNIIEGVAANPRPLVRNAASHAAVIQNNTLLHISDTASYANPVSAASKGPLTPLRFEVGAQGETFVESWKSYPNTFSGWLAAQDWGSTPLAEQTALADPDHDGWNNFLEFFADTAPQRPDEGSAMALSQNAAGQRILSFRARPGGIQPIAIEIEFSDALRDWSPVTPAPPIFRDEGTGRFSLPLPLSATSRAFYRLRLTGPF